VVVNRENVGQLDELKEIADRYQAQLRLTRLRPSGRGADVWDELHPTADQQLALYQWLLRHGDDVLTGDSFFHLSAYGEPLPGLRAGNVRDPGGFARVWADSTLFRELREPQSAGPCESCGHFDSCRGGCMAAKFFTGLPLEGPDPECALGHGEAALAGRGDTPPPVASVDHSRHPRRGRPVTVCDEDPVASLLARSGR
jgi:radical SAM protein with 4Fe4S-binding SPASM domain